MEFKNDYSTIGAAKRLGISRQMVAKYRKSGRLSYTKYGRDYRYTSEAVKRLSEEIETNKNKNEPRN